MTRTKFKRGTLHLLSEYGGERQVIVRVFRTLHGTLGDWGGTSAYSLGVDFHVDVHCALCCCHPSDDWSCGEPVAPAFVVPRSTLRRRLPRQGGWRDERRAAA